MLFLQLDFKEAYSRGLHALGLLLRDPLVLRNYSGYNVDTLQFRGRYHTEEEKSPNNEWQWLFRKKKSIFSTSLGAGDLAQDTNSPR